MEKRAKISALLFISMIIVSSTLERQTIKTLQISDIIPNSDSIVSNQIIIINPFVIPLIPPSSGVQFFKDGVIFLASSKSKARMLPDHLSFGTLSTYYAVLADSTLGKPIIFSPSNQFNYPSEAITFNQDYSIMYFTKNVGDGTQKIFKAEFNEGDWKTDQNSMDFCSEKAIYTHPALSADGNIMVFSSNRSDSFGGMDLYVTVNNNGIWSEPVNMGSTINSSFNEAYPFMDKDNNLYFSSDNTQGFGGYDIYVCKFNNSTWERPVNLSIPLNTPNDDVAFTINRDNGKTAFYTIKEKAGKSSIQLYKVDINEQILADDITISQYLTDPDVSKMVILALEPAVQATGRQIATPTIRRAEARRGDDNITYRVQFLTSFNPKTTPQIIVGGQEFPVYEYLYAGAYRLCIGEFSTLSQALELQNLLIENDYPNASVTAFRNNVVSFDPDLLKEKPVVEVVPLTIEAEADKHEICAGSSVAMNVRANGGSGVYTYNWVSVPEGFKSNSTDISVTPNVTTTYTVTVNDGYNTINNQLVIKVNPPPIVDAGTNMKIPYDSKTTLRASVKGNPPYSYSWTPAILLVNSEVEDPATVNLKSTTVFTLTVTSLKTGCSSSDQITIEVEPEIKKEEPVKPVVSKQEVKEVVPVKDTVVKTTEPAKDTLLTNPKETKDIVVYRVQIISSPKTRGSFEVKVNNITYKTYEYFYLGEYRSCIGEFDNLAQARDLQFAARKAGHPQAFVAAFVNNVRSTDMSLFK
jgi:hypothetical protein